MEVLWVLAYAAAVVGFGYWANEYNRNPIGWGFLFVIAPLLALILLPLLGPIKKNKFCPECGAHTDPETGTCPNCNRTSEPQAKPQPEQAPKAKPETNTRSEPAVNLNEPKNTNTADHSTSGVVMVNSENFSLDFDKVLAMIERKIPLVKDQGNQPTELLSKFKIVDYVSSAQIDPIKLNGILTTPSASSYFTKDGHLHMFDFNPASPAKEKSDEQFVKIYQEQRNFEHTFSFSVFDTFFVIEIYKPKNQSEFLVLAPDYSSEGEAVETFMSGMLSKHDLLLLFDILNASRRNLCILALLIDDILVELSRTSATSA